MRTQFGVEDMAIHRIVEKEYGFEPIRTFLPGLTQERLDENLGWLAPKALEPSTQKVVFCFQSYVVRTPHFNVLVDSCIGNDKTARYPEWLGKSDVTWMTALRAAGLGVDDIDYVLCTHLHGDHVGWNTRLENGRWVPTFPKARYVFSRVEYEHWDKVHRTTPIPSLAESVLPIVEAKKAELVAGDHALGDHVRLVPTPGHTPGHVAVAIGRQGDAAVFTGDLIHSPLQARYPELATRADSDPDKAGETRRAFLERYCDTGTLCCTMHFPSPSVGHIKRWGNGFRCDYVA